MGELDTPVGRLPAFRAHVDLRVIDVLSLSEGRISAIWTVADWLGALGPAGLVQVPAPSLAEGAAAEN